MTLLPVGVWSFLVGVFLLLRFCTEKRRHLLTFSIIVTLLLTLAETRLYIIESGTSTELILTILASFFIGFLGSSIYFVLSRPMGEDMDF